MQPSPKNAASAPEIPEPATLAQLPESTQEIESIAGLPGDALMPELEELVKKNPNRLIGCGG